MRLKELQIAIIATLKAEAGLTGLLAIDPVDDIGSAVYDHVPENTEFPYVTVGEPSGVEHDADDILGWTGQIVVHSWSRFRGFEEITAIMRQTDNALHRAEPAVTDARIVTLHRESVDSVLDQDGLTRHGIHAFRVILEEL